MKTWAGVKIIMKIAMTHFQIFHFQGQGGLHKLLILDDARDCLLPLHRDDSKTAQLTPIKSNMCLSPSQSPATSEFEKEILSLFLSHRSAKWAGIESTSH